MALGVLRCLANLLYLPIGRLSIPVMSIPVVGGVVVALGAPL